MKIDQEKELEVGEWPPVSSEPLPVSTPTRTVAPAAAAASAASAAPAPAAAPATAKASTRSSAMSAEFEGVKLTELCVVSVDGIYHWIISYRRNNHFRLTEFV